MKAIIWSESKKAALWLLVMILSIFGIFGFALSPLGKGVKTITSFLMGLITFISANAYKYYGMERKVVFDDEEGTFTLDRGEIYMISRLFFYLHIPLASDISDISGWFSEKTGKRKIKYSDIKYVKITKEDGRDVIIIGYKGIWDSTAKLRIYGKETGKERLKEIAKEFKKRAKGENYEYTFEDEIGIIENIIDLNALSGSEKPFEIK